MKLTLNMLQMYDIANDWEPDQSRPPNHSFGAIRIGKENRYKERVQKSICEVPIK